MNKFDFYRESNKSNLIQLCPVAILLNGVGFSRLKYGSQFDQKFHAIMENCAEYMMNQIEANFVWIHQDKMLFLFKNSLRSNFSTIFDSSVADLNLKIAAICSSYFNLVNKPEDFDQIPIFSCQSWNLPTAGEVIDYISLLEHMAAREAIYRLGESVIGNEVFQCQPTEVISQLAAAGYNWEELAPAFKSGTWIQKTNNGFNAFSMPLVEIENKEDFIFNGKNPKKIVRVTPEGV